MPKGQDLSRHQKKIVDRYYEHRDTIMQQKLREIVSDLYLADAKKAERLWESARKAMQNLKIDEAAIDRVMRDRNVASLATLVGGLK
jgi:hypothetical protein